MIQTAVFHEGELAVQRLAGETTMAQANGRVIAGAIPKGALSFLEQQPMVVAATVDGNDRPWASILVGSRGFVRSPDATLVEIHAAQEYVVTSDPIWNNLEINPQLGLLGIEFDRRRRLRINGRASLGDLRRIQIDVHEAYPNCPKYIHRRFLRSMKNRPATSDLRTGVEPGEEQIRTIQRANTVFVASIHPARGADASHRGGSAGFVEWVGPRTLRMPDYPGNSMYNTLGNITVQPYMGVTILDFEETRVLQMTGAASLHFDQPDPSGTTGGTRRFWQLRVDAWREWDLPVEMDWEQLDASPFNPPAGTLPKLI